MDKTPIKNRNYYKTEESIKNALVSLYRKKGDFKKITVKELCEVANISRSTFYLHYSDLISIFESVGNKFVDSLKVLITDLSTANITDDFSDYIKTIFQLLDESSDIFKIGISSDYPLIYIDRVKAQLEKLIKLSPALSKTRFGQEQTLIEIRIVVSGLIDFVISLLRSGEKIDQDKHIKTINSFVVRWAQSITLKTALSKW